MTHLPHPKKRGVGLCGLRNALIVAPNRFDACDVTQRCRTCIKFRDRELLDYARRMAKRTEVARKRGLLP